LKSWLSHSLSKISFLYGTRRFITILTKSRHSTLSRASLNQFFPLIPISLRSNLMLSPSTPMSSQWSPSFEPPNQNPVNNSPLPHACHMSRPPHSPWFNHPNNVRCRDSSVGIALGYGLDERSSSIRFPEGAVNISLHNRVQNGSGAHPASHPMGTRAISLGVKQPVREADHSPPTSAKVKEWVELYLHSPIRLHGVVLS
jgi:hypothetical protein